MFAKSRPVLGIVVFVLVSGCGGGADPVEEMTPESMSRLDAIGETENLVLGVSMKNIPETLPLSSGRELNRHEGLLLVEIPKDAFEEFTKVPGIQRMEVWGKASDVRKMDHWLQAQVLESWAEEAPSTLSCLARFKPGTQNLKQRLTEVGAEPRTVAGIVVTLDASPGAMLKILEMPELESINQPRQLTPNRN